MYLLLVYINGEIDQCSWIRLLNLINTHIFSKYIYILYLFSPHLAKISTKFFFKHDKLISKLIWKCKKTKKKVKTLLKKNKKMKGHVLSGMKTLKVKEIKIV